MPIKVNLSVLFMICLAFEGSLSEVANANQFKLRGGSIADQTLLQTSTQNTTHLTLKAVGAFHYVMLGLCFLTFIVGLVLAKTIFKRALVTVLDWAEKQRADLANVVAQDISHASRTRRARRMSVAIKAFEREQRGIFTFAMAGARLNLVTGLEFISTLFLEMGLESSGSIPVGVQFGILLLWSLFYSTIAPYAYLGYLHPSRLGGDGVAVNLGPASISKLSLKAKFGHLISVAIIVLMETCLGLGILIILHASFPQSTLDNVPFGVIVELIVMLTSTYLFKLGEIDDIGSMPAVYAENTVVEKSPEVQAAIKKMTIASYAMLVFAIVVVAVALYVTSDLQGFQHSTYMQIAGYGVFILTVVHLVYAWFKFRPAAKAQTTHTAHGGLA